MVVLFLSLPCGRHHVTLLVSHRSVSSKQQLPWLGSMTVYCDGTYEVTIANTQIMCCMFLCKFNNHHWLLAVCIIGNTCPNKKGLGS